MLVIGVDATQLAVVAVQAYLAAVLTVAGLGKARSIDAFAGVIRQHELAPKAAWRPLAALVVVVEVVLGTALMLGLAVVGTSIATCALFVAFSLLTTRMLLSRRQVPCGCFGSADRDLVSWRTPLRSMILAGIAAALAILAQSVGGGPIFATVPTTVVFLFGWAITSALRRAAPVNALKYTR